MNLIDFECLSLYQIPISLSGPGVLDHFLISQKSADFKDSNHVHLWIAKPGKETAGFKEYLDASEQIRKQKFKLEAQKRDFAYTRSMLRQILSLYMGMPPQDIQFEYGGNGKPAIMPKQNKGNLAFNLSHSDGYFACAVTYRNAVGVDLEHVTPNSQQIANISRSFYLPAEAANIASAEEPGCYFLFYKYWTIKEACIKADGHSVMQLKDSADLSHLTADEMGIVTPVSLPGKSGFTTRLAGNTYLAVIWCNNKYQGL